MMTPSQEAKAYAAEHGYTLTSNYSIRRIIVSHGDREVGRYAKYEGCINAMRADRSAMGVVESALFDGMRNIESHINKFAADVGKAMTDAFGVPAPMLRAVHQSETSGAPPMPVWSLLKRDSRPRWRLWWKYPDGDVKRYGDFHNYAEAVKELRRIYSHKFNGPIAIAAGIKYSISLIQ